MLLAQRGKVEVSPLFPHHFRQTAIDQYHMTRLVLRLIDRIIEQLLYGRICRRAPRHPPTR